MVQEILDLSVKLLLASEPKVWSKALFKMWPNHNPSIYFEALRPLLLGDVSIGQDDAPPFFRVQCHFRKGRIGIGDQRQRHAQTVRKFE